tara:strand:- start:476 stop:643 length:168 start_codon:yes stop_codon:yes gene_type:complete
MKCEYCNDTGYSSDYLHNQDVVFETFPCPNCNKKEHKEWYKQEYGENYVQSNTKK